MKIQNESFQKGKLNDFIIPGSSIGVYHVYNELNYNGIVDTVSDILFKGIKGRSFTNIFTKINIVGTKDNYDNKALYNIGVDGINIIVAIPDELVDSKGHKYYVGDFSCIDRRFTKKNDMNEMELKSLWFYNYMDHHQYFPREFIVGACIGNGDRTQILLNPNYIGLKSFKEQQNITDKMIEEYPKRLTGKPLEWIDEKNAEKKYQAVLSEIAYYHNRGESALYYEGLKEYLEKNYHLGSKKK